MNAHIPIFLDDKIFYINSFFSIFYYAYLAINWKQLMLKFTHLDKIMKRSYGYPKYLDVHIKIATYTFLLLSAGT